MIHQLKERTAKGSPTKCGQVVPHQLATIWESSVNCPDCIAVIAAEREQISGA